MEFIIRILAATAAGGALGIGCCHSIDHFRQHRFQESKYLVSEKSEKRGKNR